MRNNSSSILYVQRVEALQLLSLTAAAFSLVALLLLLFQFIDLGYSLVMGGLVWLVPNLYFALRVFSLGKGLVNPQRMLINFYRAEIFKMFLCAIFFMLVVKFLAVAILPALAGYSLAQVVFWVSPFLLNRVKGSVKK